MTTKEAVEAKKIINQKYGFDKTDKQKQEAFYAALGIEYLGLQERPDKFPLEMFNDLVTGNTHVREPEESIFDMVDRIRKGE